MIKIYEVGGSVRDFYLGVNSKDKDFCVEASSWEEMREYIYSISSKVFLEKPEYFTIRAHVDGEAKDFVLARKDGAYSDGRRPDYVEAGTIFDDLARRDFTVNAIAIDAQTKEIIDPHGGFDDLNKRILRCVGNTRERFEEDTLRIIRAIRFKITKGFQFDEHIACNLTDPVLSQHWADKIALLSEDRIREELFKCFKHSTADSLDILSYVNPSIRTAIFKRDLWLMPTTSK
jgi:tRNA nucleotidyltransferase/poly(A) polymerase